MGQRRLVVGRGWRGCDKRVQREGCRVWVDVISEGCLGNAVRGGGRHAILATHHLVSSRDSRANPVAGGIANADCFLPCL